MRKYLGNRVFLSLAALTLSACVTTGTQEAPELLPPPKDENVGDAPERIDADVLLDVRALRKNLVLKQITTHYSRSGVADSSYQSGRYNVGPALRTVLEQALGKVFKSVAVYDRATEVAGYRGSYDIVLLPQLMEFGSKYQPHSYSQPAHVGRVQIKFFVLNSSRMKMGDFSIVAEGSPSSGFHFGSEVPDLINNLLKNLRNNIVMELPRQNAIERWRMQAGLADDLARRARNGDVAAAVRLGRIHEKYGEFDEAEKWFCMAGEEGKRMSAYEIHCNRH